MGDFKETDIWRKAFVLSRTDCTPSEQEFFKLAYLSMREKAAHLVSRIGADMPMMTVHDITHLDALWRTASLAAGGQIDLSPAAAFVFGGSILLHDSAMSLAAHEGGEESLKLTTAWKDAVARQLLDEQDKGDGDPSELEGVPERVASNATQDALRQLHAEQAEVLATRSWKLSNGDVAYLIDSPELRNFYGTTIGRIAHSHWWDVERVEREFCNVLGPLPGKTQSPVDTLLVAALLRVADVLHVDQLRAPIFLRSLINPSGHSGLHWDFQGHLSAPMIEGNDIVFTTGRPFLKSESEAWWLCYDTLNYADRELRDTATLLFTNGRPELKGKSIRGALSPEMLSSFVRTEGWRPLDAKVKVSDVPRVVEALGGAQLYGKDLTIPIRELIQNAADSVNARRILEGRDPNWGRISVQLIEEDGAHSLIVEDTGIGMSEAVMVGPLIDFGTSFWRTPLAGSEFPGLLSKGMRPKGKFGIGFFSTFMLGENVSVGSQRFDRGLDGARVLEFGAGLASRPLLSPAQASEVPIDRGTRITVRLFKSPFDSGGFLEANVVAGPMTLNRLIGIIAPASDVTIAVDEYGEKSLAVEAHDWKSVSSSTLALRCAGHGHMRSGIDSFGLMAPVLERDGTIVGRLGLNPKFASRGALTVSGLASERIGGVVGLLPSKPMTIDRRRARPIASAEALEGWATEQARLALEKVDGEFNQASIAEFVLAFGGKIGELKVASFAGDWLSSDELIDFLKERQEIFVRLEGEIEYEEDVDEVSSREFEEGFEFADDVLFVPQLPVYIRQSSWSTASSQSNDDWFSKKAPSHLAQHVIDLITEAWGHNSFQHDTGFHQVGTVDFDPIERAIDHFERLEESGDLTLR
jgi:hypothetical protein